MIVSLSPQDAVFPCMIGMQRQIFALSRRLVNHHNGEDAQAFDYHIRGAMAEFAVARALNLFWEPQIGLSDAPDVGGAIDVRLRRIPGTGADLTFRAKDHDERPYVLVHNRGDLAFELIGWLYGREGKARGVFNERAQVWFVPPPYRPVDHLFAMFGTPAPFEKRA